MRFNLLILLAILCACSSKPTPQIEREQQRDRILKLLDDRRYTDVVQLIELEVPAHRRHFYQIYLAQAYLGLADFVPTEFANKVLESQNGAIEPSDKLIPRCPRGALRAEDQPPPRCVIWRLFRQLPSPADLHFKKAREILQEAFPVPDQTSDGYNVLIGAVELATAIGDLQTLLTHYLELDPLEASDQEIDELFDQAAHTAETTLAALTRATAIESRLISEFLSGLKSDSFFVGQGASLNYLEATGLPMIIEILKRRGESLEVIALRVLLVRQLDQTLEELNRESELNLSY